MRISAKADYAVRAAVELAAATDERPVKAERIATAQDIPLNFLENILGELRHAGIVRSHRGAEGGFRLAKPADQLTVADVIRAVEGPLASVRGGPPEDAAYPGAATALPRVWIAVRANLRKVVEQVTLADVAARKAARDDRQAGRGPGGLGHALSGPPSEGRYVGARPGRRPRRPRPGRRRRRRVWAAGRTTMSPSFSSSSSVWARVS